MTIPANTLESAFEALLQATMGAPRGQVEHREALASFVSVGPDQALARRRAEEWFLLERFHQSLGGVPVELAMHGELEVDDIDEESLAALVSSITGVFEVTGIQAGEGVWVRDLLAFGEFPLEEREGSRALTEGDLMVGRLFPVGDGLHRISRAAGVFRNRELKDALRRDLEQARAARRGVLRLSSPDLERMFWGPSPVEEQRRREAAARAVLIRGGLGGETVEGVFARLRAVPFDGRVLPGGSDALGEVLAELAFETEVDLNAARTALLALWPLMHRGRTGVSAEQPEAGATPAVQQGSPDPRAAMEAFDRGRRAGRDLEELFAELERDLELDSEEPVDDAAPEEDPAPDFTGVVGALVEEYLWELERESGAAAAREQAVLRKLSVFGEPIGLFEELGARELLSFASLWLPEWGELNGADEAQTMLRSLRSFCDWIDQGHEIPLRAAYDEAVAPLEQSLPRIAEANRARITGADPAAGQWYVVQAVDGNEVTLQGARAVEPYAIVPELAAHLREGDLVRGEASLTPERVGELAVYCAYPAAARELTSPGRD